MIGQTHIMRILLLILHALFWIGLFQLFFWVNTLFIPKELAILKGVFAFLLFAGIFYTHSLVLINLLLERKKYVWYFLGALFLLLGATWLRFVIDERLPDSRLPVQLFLSKKRPLLGPFFITLFWMCFSFIYQLLINRVKREKKHMAKLNEFVQSQNQLLKNQINPHFLFNNLNNLYSLIETQSPNASEMVLKLSDILRYTVYQSTDKRVLLNEELKQVKNLIDLYQLKENGSLNIRIDETENKVEVLLEPMLLIPLIENCFKHGNYNTDKQAVIFISIKTTPHECICTVSNSIPKQSIPISQSGGFGLSNLKQRLQLIYGNNAELHTESVNQIFTATLRILWNEQ